MGRFGFNARKYIPRLASGAYLKLQFAANGKVQKQYADYFLSQDPVPMPNVVNIETINRCNSTCEFCPANVHSEKRPFRKIDDALYHSIIDQLADWGYKGHLTLYGNNEPMLDPRYVEFHKYAREKLPDCFIFMSTNGLLMNIDRLKEIQPYINQLIINNYALEYKLHDNLQEIYEYVKAHPDEFSDLDIEIQMRYLKEVLTNRAGSSPNKKATEKVITNTCLLPFTDMWIMPNGKMGLCCCDDFEVTALADLNKVSVKEGWSSPALIKTSCPFCTFAPHSAISRAYFLSTVFFMGISSFCTTTARCKAGRGCHCSDGLTHRRPRKRVAGSAALQSEGFARAGCAFTDVQRRDCYLRCLPPDSKAVADGPRAGERSHAEDDAHDTVKYGGDIHAIREIEDHGNDRQDNRDYREHIGGHDLDRVLSADDRKDAQ